MDTAKPDKAPRRRGCFEREDRQYAITGDIVNECIEKMPGADGIILTSPKYFADILANMKALIERAVFVARANGDMFRRKVGASGVAVRLVRDPKPGPHGW
jgi:multimeric flavodoxin WrbA